MRPPGPDPNGSIAISGSTPVERFFSEFLEDWGKGGLRSLESYLSEFPAELAPAIKAAFHARSPESSPGDHTFDELSPQSIGPYAIVEELGRGGQGLVYLAEDTRLGRRVALKVLTSWGAATEQVVERFRREAAIASRLEHPGICTVYETGTAQGVPYMAMRLVEGESLSRRIAAASADPDTATASFVELDTDVVDTEADAPSSDTSARTTQAEILRIATLMEAAARALHAAHEAGVIHRDIKPGNIMVTPDGDPVLLDFGLARETDGDDVSLTRTGDLFGTPAYMAPEQLLAKRIRVDRRADVWALGVTLFECLCLKRPFDAPTREGLYQQILYKDPPDLRTLNKSIPKDLAVIVQTATDKDRDRRYQTALDLAEDLRRFRTFEPIQAKPVGQLTKLVRWTQRNPAVATLTAALFLAMATGLIWIWSQKSELAASNTALQAKTQEAEASARIALQKTQEAEANAAAARGSLSDWERLADKQRLADLVREADEELWPAAPGKAAAMEAWLKKARVLGERLPDHRRVLEALQRKALERTEEERQADRTSHADEQTELAAVEGEGKKLDAATKELRQQLVDTNEQLAALENQQELSARDELRVESLEEKKERLGATLARYTERRSELEEQRATLMATLEERVSWRFSDPRDQIRHDGLLGLVQGLEVLTGPEKPGSVTLESMASRLEFARTVEKRSVHDHQGAWDAATDRIAKSALYGGLSLRPQTGLIPLGPDPDSRLEEFAHLQTGTPPVRDEESGKLVLTEDSGLVFVLIPGGTFTMGAQKEDPGKGNYDPQATPIEGPPHAVSLAPFLVSKYEMTQGQWTGFTAVNPSTHPPGSWKVSLLNPVEQVSWPDCDRTLRRLGLLLPTEAQWEYACRAGSTTPWWTGEDRESLRGAVNLADQAAKRAGAPWNAIKDWPDLDDGYAVHAPVGSYRANRFGLHNVHGNVFEWCLDGYLGYGEGEPRAGDGLRGLVEGARERVLRGGCFNLDARHARSAIRRASGPGLADYYLGLRPARRITP